jgi:hypothetical protein
LLEIKIVNLDLVSESATIMIFKVSILLDGLSSLMICTYDLTVLTKTEEMILVNHSDTVAKAFSTKQNK